MNISRSGPVTNRRNPEMAPRMYPVPVSLATGTRNDALRFLMPACRERHLSTPGTLSQTKRPHPLPFCLLASAALYNRASSQKPAPPRRKKIHRTNPIQKNRTTCLKRIYGKNTRNGTPGNKPNQTQSNPIESDYDPNSGAAFK
jgi:hypothetical protein